MAVITSYAPGTPCWVDLTSTDPPAARAFYSGLFGWRIEVEGEETGFYGIAHIGDHPVAGVNGLAADPGSPTGWMIYLATEDVDATAAAVINAGGTLAMPALDIPGQGRMAVAIDPLGAPFGLWQGDAHVGATLVNEPATLSWNELHSSNLARANEFFGDVFPMTFQQIGDGVDFDYTTMQLGDRTIGGMMQDRDDPSGWVTYFAVANADASCDVALGLGANVLTPPVDTLFGRMAGVRDPTGCRFMMAQLPADAAANA